MSRPKHLVVVGAAGGIGRWLGDHVLGSIAWDSVVLLDAADAVLRLDHRYGPSATAWAVAGAVPPQAELSRAETLVVLAVPLTTLADVASALLPRLAPDAIVVDTSHDRTRATAELRRAGLVDHVSVGLHALFGINAESAEGQTFVVCPSAVDVRAHIWLVDVLEAAGASVNVMGDEHHDDIMRTVQTAAHHAVISFADVVGRSGLDLEADLWANRTPVFELLLALAARVLAPGQEVTSATIQTADDLARSDTAFDEANARLAAARNEGAAAVAAHLASVREPFSGGLFTKIQQAGALATSAVQATRAEIAHHRRAYDLVGVVPLGSDRLHVGRVEKVTATSFVLRDLLVGAKGNAAVLSDAQAVENARRSGIAGKVRTVEFRLGRVRILSPRELDTELDAWLATVSRGCKFLIPESISGRSAQRVVDGVSDVVRAELISEEVRLGQRECVVRFTTRLDKSLDAVERAIQHRVDEVFVWPDGAVLPLSGDEPEAIGFLGPAGTFSDIAARQLSRLVAVPNAQRAEYPDFPTLICALIDESVDLVVLPITSSSTGLVDLAAGVLASTTSALTAGGVVDVPVRFDAYVAPDGALAPGDQVFSHPQGLRQCSQFIAANHLVEVICTSTVDACRQVSESGRGVALAATGLEDEYGLALARASVGNLAGALTRFLVLGREGRFAPPVRADALERSLWILDSAGAALIAQEDVPSYDEILRGPSGRSLLISTRRDRLRADHLGARYLGTIPWSPRTPIVVVE